MTKSFKSLQAHISESKIGSKLSSIELRSGELVLTTSPNSIESVLKFLRDDSKCMFKQLVSISGVDYPAKEKRFEVVYNLLSFEFNERIRVTVSVAELELVPTASKIFSSATWYEREVWDMYGVLFEENPDMRRILTDYGFEGHPLRKDFPLTGNVEVRYDLKQKKVVYEPVNLAQEFRRFDFSSPWNGTDYVLPGDEKATKD